MAEYFCERLYTTDGICRDMPGSRGRLKSRVNEIQCNPAKMYSLLLMRLRFAFRVTKIYSQESYSRRFHRDNIETQCTHIYIYMRFISSLSRVHSMNLLCVIGLVGSILRKHIEISIFNLFRRLYYNII